MRQIKFLCICLFGLLIVPTTLGQGYGCEADIEDSQKEDCYPNVGSEEECRARDCVWCPDEPGGPVPWCFFYNPEILSGYTMVGEAIDIPNGIRVNLARSAINASSTRGQRRHRAWEGEAETLTLDASFQSDYRLRVKIYPDTPRFEVPLEILPATGGNSNPLYDIQFSSDPLFSFKIIRRSSGTVLFETHPNQFIFADQYITLGWTPGSRNVYGIGENEQHSFRHDFSRGLTWALWARDQPPSFTGNIYGVQPHYTTLEDDGNAHAVAIVNSNAQQFTLSESDGSPSIRYTTTGGLLDIYVFLGPTPENTVEQYTEAVGRPPMPPYFALGFQLCRFGYNSIANMKAAVDRTAQYGIPHDVQYGDIDIMERRLDFTYSEANFPGLPDYIRELKGRGIKFVTILDPCISIGENPATYRPLGLGNEMDVWLKKPNGQPVVGKVWPTDPVYFPDYSKDATKEWWKILIREFHDLLEWDGLWIDMNEPANFVVGDITDGCPENNLNNPPFVPAISGNYLPQMTVCPDHVQAAGNHYDVHSLYGWFQSEPTLTGAREGTGKRALVLSRSTFLGSGRWAAHWLGDNWSRWDNLHYSIIGMLQFNQFGIPFNGADICGFLENSNAEMCQRWMLLGSFYPFARNHNVDTGIDQDPGVWGEAVAVSSREALLVRYTMLPYLYTLFYKVATGGGTVVRGLWHNFPTDANTYGIDTQFMWGSGLLVTAVIQQGATSVEGYLPDARAYDYFTGAEESTRGGTVNFPTPMDKINLHLIGGNVIPTQEPAINTELARQNPMGLIVALDDQGAASGSLFYDDGDSIGTIESGSFFAADFSVADKTLISAIVSNGYPEMSSKRFTTIRLLGAGTVNSVTVNGAAHSSFSTLPFGEVLIQDLILTATQAFTVSWA